MERGQYTYEFLLDKLSKAKEGSLELNGWVAIILLWDEWMVEANTGNLSVEEIIHDFKLGAFNHKNYTRNLNAAMELIPEKYMSEDGTITIERFYDDGWACSLLYNNISNLRYGDFHSGYYPTPELAVIAAVTKERIKNG